MSSTWQLQTAKQRFSEVVRGAQSGEPQFITKHGEPVAVLVDIADYRQTHGESESLAERVWRSARAIASDVDLELPPRTIDPDRSAEIFEDLL